MEASAVFYIFSTMLRVIGATFEEAKLTLAYMPHRLFLASNLASAAKSEHTSQLARASMS